jgi:hypothetical protein
MICVPRHRASLSHRSHRRVGVGEAVRRSVITRRALGGERKTFDRWQPAAVGGIACVALSAVVAPVAISHAALHLRSWVNVVTGSAVRSAIA